SSATTHALQPLLTIDMQLLSEFGLCHSAGPRHRVPYRGRWRRGIHMMLQRRAIYAKWRSHCARQAWTGVRRPTQPTPGVSAQAVSKWENGESLPDVALLPALRRVLGA